MKGTDGSVDGRGNDDSNSEEAGLAEPQKGQVRRVWYRSVPFQIAVASGVSFTAPGMWDALGGLGAGGAAEPVSDKTCTRLRNSILILQTVRCFGSQCPGLRSLFRLLRPRGSNQQPHRPEIRSCSRCNRLSSLRSRSILRRGSCYSEVLYAESLLVSSGPPKQPSSSDIQAPRNEHSTWLSGRPQRHQVQS